MPELRHKSNNYEEFVAKFQTKKTTDDCYTPPAIYDAVQKWAISHSEIDISQLKIIRPFYPGGDYESEDYTGSVVIDNPPFSILSKIVRFYEENEIPYFVFGFLNTMGAVYQMKAHCYIVIDEDIVYENGAKIPTCFITNLIKSHKIILAKSLAEELYKLQEHHPIINSKRGPRAHNAADLRKYIKRLPEDTGLDIEGRDKSLYGGGFILTKESEDKLNEVYAIK